MAALYSNVDIKKFGDLKQQNMNFLQERTAKLSKLKVRKNAVLSVNLVFSASPELFKSKSKTAAWEKATFDFIVKEFGVENIVYAVVHHDETTPHMQVSVIPVDPKGKLNASHFFDGRKKCDEFATRYNLAVRHLGLLRDKGKEKSKPSETKDFYQKVEEAKKDEAKVDEAVQKLEEKLSSPTGLIRSSTAKNAVKPLVRQLKNLQTASINNRAKVEEAEKLKQENELLKSKFEEMGLAPDMGFLQCQQVKKQIAVGKAALAEMEAKASKVLRVFKANFINSFFFLRLHAHLPKKKKIKPQ